MFVIKKRNIIIISVLLVTAITFIICFSALTKTSAGAEITGITVVLDAGHGGIDGGVVGARTGVKESELNLKIVKKLEKYLIDGGINPVLTRKTEAGLYGVAVKNLKRRDMEKRREIILKARPALVVSVHLNKFSVSSRRGAQIFYKEGDKNSHLLAESIQSVFNQMEESVREFSPLSGDYYLLNCSEYPSVIAECGFLSNPEEEALLITEDYQDKVAYSLFKGIVTYLAKASYNAQTNTFNSLIQQ